MKDVQTYIFRSLLFSIGVSFILASFLPIDVSTGQDILNRSLLSLGAFWVGLTIFYKSEK